MGSNSGLSGGVLPESAADCDSIISGTSTGSREFSCDKLLWNGRTGRDSACVLIIFGDTSCELSSTIRRGFCLGLEGPAGVAVEATGRAGGACWVCFAF